MFGDGAVEDDVDDDAHAAAAAAANAIERGERCLTRGIGNREWGIGTAGKRETGDGADG